MARNELRAVITVLLAAASTAGAAGCNPRATAGEYATSTPRPPVRADSGKALPSPGEIQAVAPPFSEGIFPCSDCHEGSGNPERRELEAHEDVQAIFTHDSAHRWCLDCHDNENRDVLRLASGAHVPFTESFRLCGQCHGDKYRDWRAGIHGKRIGLWNGPRTYFLCVHCHNPHSPRFAAMTPEPPPQRPEEMRR